MELNDLKSNWQNAGEAFKSERDIQKMTMVIHHPVLKKIRKKLIVETVALVLISFVYYDWFDGAQKPLYANVLLVSSILLFILNDVIGYISVAKPVRRSNLKLSLQNYLSRIKRLSYFSVIISILYGVSLVIFFTSVINFTKEKSFILLGAIIVMCQLYLFSFRMWFKWIKSLNQQVKDFEED